MGKSIYELLTGLDRSKLLLLAERMGIGLHGIGASDELDKEEIVMVLSTEDEGRVREVLDSLIGAI